MGNAPFAGRIDDAAGAGAQVAVVDAGFDGLDGGFEVERLVVDGGHQEPVPPGQGGARYGLFGAAKHHAVHAALRDFARLAKLCGHTGQVQQLDDDVL